MKALVYTGPEELEVRDVPAPVPAPGEVLVHVAHAGICGSDMHAYLGHDERRPAPLILGHEIAGVTDDGRRCAVRPLVTCGRCEYCREGRDNLCPTREIVSMPPREGGFAEMLAVPEANVVTIADATPTHKAALVEPLACSWHAVRLAREASRRPLGDCVCLSYGGGAIGVGAALALRAQGAREIWLAEPNADRRAYLEGVDGFRVFDPTADDGPAADVVVDGVGIEATRAASTRAVKPGGVVAHIGLGSASGGLDVRRMTLQEITFFGTYTFTRRDFEDTAEALEDGRLGSADWVAMDTLDGGPEAFARIRRGETAAPKTMFRVGA